MRSANKTTINHKPTSKSRLSLGVAGFALAISVAQPAQAACPDDGTTVTCSDPGNTVVVVNGALGGLAGPDQNLIVDGTATIVGPGTVTPLLLPGAITVTNSGTWGTDIAPVNFNYVNNLAPASNTMVFTNGPTGIIEGFVFSVSGGDATFVNDGTVNGGIDFRSLSQVDATLNGSSAFTQFVGGNFQLVTSPPPTVVVAGTVTTTTTTSSRTNPSPGSVMVNVGAAGSVGVLRAFAVGGDITMNINGSVGSDMAPGSVLANSTAAADNFSNSTVTQTDTALPAGNFNTVIDNESTVLGGRVDFAINGTGLVVGSVNLAGRGAAIDATINGTIGTDMTAADLNIDSSGTNSEFDRTDQSTNGVDFSRMDSSTTTDASGAVTVNMNDGSVSRNVGINGGSGGITANLVNASIGSAATNGDLLVNSRAQNFANTSNFTNDGMGATSNSNTGTTTDSSGAIAVDISGGSISDDVNVIGGGAGATLNLTDGSIGSPTNRGDLNVNTNVSDTANSNNASNDGMGTTVNGNTFNLTNSGGNSAISLSNATVTGNVFADAGAGNATIALTNGGQVGIDGVFASSVNANASGTNRQSSNNNSTTLGMGGDFTNANSGSTLLSASGGTADVQISNDSTVSGNVNLTADTAVVFDSAGRIKGDVFLFSARSLDTENSFDNNFSRTTDMAGIVTDVTNNSSTFSRVTVGGTANFNNSGIIGDPVVSAVGGVTFTNSGVILADTTVQSLGSTFANANTFMQTTVSPPAPGNRTIDTVSTFSQTTTNNGNSVNFTNSGNIGAVQFTPTNANVNLSANQDITIDNSGQIVGNLSATTSGQTSVSQGTTTTNQVITDYLGVATPNTVTTNDVRSGSTTNTSGGITASISGRINGQFGGGNVNLNSGAGNASLTLMGGRIDRNATVRAGNVQDSSFNNVSDTVAVDGVLQSQSFMNSSDTTQVTADATASLVGGRVDGSVFVNASGNATASVDATSNVAGSVNATVFGRNTTNFNNFTGTLGMAGATGTQDFGNTSTNVGGNATITVAGIVGGTSNATSGAGNAAVNVTGVSTSGINAITGAVDSTSTTNQVRSGPSLFPNTVNMETFDRTLTNVGGTASVDITIDPMLAAANTPSVVTGNINVTGLAGSDLTIGANSIVFSQPFDANNINVGMAFTNSVTNRTTDFTGTGTQTVTVNRTIVGGDSTFTNNGMVGFNQNNNIFAYYDNGNNSASVNSPTNATFVNNGGFYSDIVVNALTGTNSTVSNSTNFNDAVNRVDVTTNTYTPVGGVASATNTRLIAGNASVFGATGSFTNSGVTRGDVLFGRGVRNYTTTRTDTAFATGTETITGVNPLFVQTYTLDQNGLLAGANSGVAVTIQGAFDPGGLPVGAGVAGMTNSNGALQTSTINATVNLNNGSVTAGSIWGDHEIVSGTRYTNTAVNLNGGGFLGLSAKDPFRTAESIAAVTPFGQFDSVIQNNLPNAAITAAGLFRGVRVRGVDSIDKNGAGTFVFNGETGTVTQNIGSPNVINYTVDAGETNINAGRLELDVGNAAIGSNVLLDPTLDPSEGVFAVRGNLTNGADLVLGRQVTLDPALFVNNIVGQGSTVVDGIQGFQNGNFTQTNAGTLHVGVTPDLVRAGNVGASLSGAPGIFGFSPASVNLPGFTTPANSNITAFNSLSPSYWVMNGDLTLAGTVSVATITNSLFVGGSTTDLFRVNGAVDISGATVADGLNSPFVSFGLSQRTEGGREVVSIQVQRASYTTGAGDPNAAAAAAALDTALPTVVGLITTDAAGGNAFQTVEQFGLVQDLASVMAALDTQMTTAQIGQAFVELSSAEMYGSLMATRTTDPFGTFISGLPVNTSTANGHFFIWGNMAANFARFDANTAVGASGLRSDNYGGSGGFGFATGSGFKFGAGAGYSKVNAETRGNNDTADGETFMVGAFTQAPIGPVNLGAQAVFGWTNWDSSRELPLFSRTAVGSFDSQEFRLNARASYDYNFNNNLAATPFVEAELRRYDFDAFAEQNAGGIGLNVQEVSKTVFSPTVGVDLTGQFETSLADLFPKLTVSYTFQGDTDANRTVSYLGDQGNTFALRGVDPSGFFTIGGSLNAKIGSKSGAFIKASYSTGNRQDAATVSAGVKIGL